VRREGLTTVVLVPSPDAPREKVREVLAEYQTFQIEKDDAAEIRLQMRAAEPTASACTRSTRASRRFRNRIDQFGVAETTVVKQGTNRILVELPGVSDQPGRGSSSARRRCWSSSSSTSPTVSRRRSRHRARGQARCSISRRPTRRPAVRTARRTWSRSG